MNYLKAKGLNVSIGRKRILNEIGFSARAGELTAIVGPNGSGKSTLLKALTGEIYSQGCATMNGLPIRNATPEALADMRAVLPQATPLSFPFQVLEVVRLGLRFRSPSSETTALQALNSVGLGGYEYRLYQELSGGEQQRVQFARVLCQTWSPYPAEHPRWLFLDEPVSSLDIAQQMHVMQLAKDFAIHGGGVLAVMHDLNLSAMFADKVLVMKDGHLVASGPVKQTLTDELLGEVYGCVVKGCTTPSNDDWYVLPHLSLVS